jgi:hypothetical protein
MTPDLGPSLQESRMKGNNPALNELIRSGEALRDRVASFLEAWPKDDDGGCPDLAVCPSDRQRAARELVNETRFWFNSVAQTILPLILYDRSFLYYKLRQAEAAVQKQNYRKPAQNDGSAGSLEISVAEQGIPLPRASPIRRTDIEVEARIDLALREADEAFETTLDLIRSTPTVTTAVLPLGSPGTPTIASGFQPNTAFILMWMDRDRIELEAVHSIFKEVCTRFGIRALRADDVQHQESITGMVLGHIQSSEFLIADLTGERPNVYYEVGFAHAIGKRPILFRRTGTHLHFDLSVHNVPEYRTLEDLKGLLEKRLEAVTGRLGSAHGT